MGYVSGHAGIAIGIGVAVFPELRPAARLATAFAMPTVALCRMYVGAHLPLDVLGGAALGLAVDATVSRLLNEGRTVIAPNSVRRLATTTGPMHASVMTKVSTWLQGPGACWDSSAASA